MLNNGHAPPRPSIAQEIKWRRMPNNVPAGVGRLLEELLLDLAADVGLVATEGPEDVPPPGEGGVGEEPFCVICFERDPLQLEEHECVVNLRRALLNALHQRTVARVGSVRGEQQADEGAGAADGFLEALVLVDRGREFGRAELQNVASIALRERL